MAQGTFANKKIAIIGMGHIGSALRDGLLKSGVKASRILASDSAKTNAAAAKQAGWIFLAVKPGMVASVLKELRADIKNKPVVSLAAGIQKSTLKKLAGKARIARIMPNMPIQIGEGVVGILNGSLTLAEKKELWKMLSGLGLLVDAKSDKELEALTLISGCGPGIVAFLVALLAENARRVGLKSAQSEAVALQTFIGALSYMGEKKLSAKSLMTRVATKGGVTEAILKDLGKNGFKKNFAQALKSGHARIRKLRT